MRQEAKKTQLCHLVMVDRLGKSGTRAAWNQRALPSGAETFWEGVRRTPVRWAKHGLHLKVESNVTAAQDQSGLSHSESPPVLSPIVTTAEQRRAVLSYATVYCCVASICRLSSLSVCTECIVAKVLIEQKLLFTGYRKSCMRNRLVLKWMTLTFVEVVTRSRQRSIALHSTLNI